METTEQELIDRLMIGDEPEAEETPEQEPEAEEEASAEEAEAEEQEEAQDAEAEEDAGQQQPETFTVKVDGRDVQVTLEDLKRGYSGNAYIQKGMQEAATKRKEAESLAQTLQGERQQFLAAVQQMQSQGVLRQPVPPDGSMLDRDPMGYMKARQKFDEDMRAYQAQQSQIEQIAQQDKAHQERQFREYLSDQAERLKADIPDFADPVKARDIQQRLISAGSEYGFTGEELMGVADARAIKVLYDAAQWRALQAGKAAAKVQQPPKVVKPAARRPEPPQLARAKQIQKAKASQSDADWVEAMLQPKRG